MSAGTFALLVVAVLLMCAGIPARTAYRARALYLADIALVFAPAPVFVLALLAFNEPAQTGWALIGYPFLVLAAAVVAFYLRVFLLSRLGVSVRVVSVVTLVVAVAAAAAFGAFVPPWYE